MGSNGLIKLINPDELICQIFQAIIRNTNNVNMYWSLVDNFIYISDYQSIILNNAKPESVIQLLQQKEVYHLSYEAAKNFDFDTFSKYSNLIDRDSKRKYIKTHHDEIISKEPKKVIDMLVCPNEIWVGYEDNEYIETALSYLPDNKYLNSFIKHGLKKRRFVEPHIFKN